MKRAIKVTMLLLLPIYCYANTIITSIKPLALFLKELTLQQDIVNNIIPVNANPHIYEPSPKDLKLIKRANLFVGIEKDFDGWIERFLSPTCKVVYLIKKNRTNPHIWLSPTIMEKKISIIMRALCTIDTLNCSKYKKKAALFENSIGKFLKNKPTFNIKVMQFHPAWDYFANDFSIKIVGTISKYGINISPKKFIQLINKAKKENVRLIFVGLNYKNLLLKNFAKKTSAKIIKLDPIGKRASSYLNFINKNINRITKAIEK